MRLLTLACMALGILCFATASQAAECYSVTIQRPSPFLGNNGEIVQLSDGSIWEVKYAYEYMYEYQPSAAICPSSGKLIVKGKSIDVQLLSGGSPRPSGAPSSPAKLITVVYEKSGCDYFIADGPRGFYLLEWYGGHPPSKGDQIVGEISGYGMKDIYYSNANSNGRVWVEDYLLSRDRVIEKYNEKCG